MKMTTPPDRCDFDLDCDICYEKAEEKREELARNYLLSDQAEDNINNPTHYTSLNARCKMCKTKIECIDVVHNMSFNLGNAVKYIWRCDLKENAIEDLKKAAWYLQDEIKRRESTRAD